MITNALSTCKKTTDQTEILWVGNRRYVTRTAALPIDGIKALRSPLLANWSLGVLALRQRVETLGAALTDRLHDLIDGEEDVELRRAQIRVRRDVFNLRLPEPAVLSVVERMDEGAQVELASWIEEMNELLALSGAGRQILIDEVVEVQVGLLSVASDELFRRGLVLASPTLDHYLDRYLTEIPTRSVIELPKKLRHIQESLLDYVYRVACKTSPFSTFTGVQVVEVSRDRGELTVSPATWGSHPRISLVALSRVGEAIRASEAGDDLLLSLVPGWSMETDRVRFLQRTVTPGDNAATVTFDLVRDTLFYLRSSGHLSRVVEIFSGHETLTRTQLLDRLVPTESGTDVEVRSRYGEYVDILLDVGFLAMPALEQYSTWRDPLESFLSAIQGLTSAVLVGIRADLVRVQRVIADYALKDHAGRRDAIVAIRTDLMSILDRLGADTRSLPTSILFEDSTTPAGVGAAAGIDWNEAVLAPLATIAELLPAFDINRGTRFTLNGYFLARYGTDGVCDDIEKFLLDFEQDVNGQYQIASRRKQPFVNGEFTGTENWLDVKALDTLDEARRMWLELVRDRVLSAGNAPIELEECDLEPVTKMVRSAASGFSSHSFFVQLAGDAQSPLVVINKIMPGLSFIFSRFTHCFPQGDFQLAREIRAEMSDYCPPDSVFAELTGGVPGTNLNLHEPLCDFHLVLPAEGSTWPMENQLHLDDLTIQYSTADEEPILWSPRLQKRVIPVYLGYLMPTALPLLARTVLTFSPSLMANVDPWAGFSEDVSAGTIHRPRVSVGKVVLSRERWTFLAEDLPLLDPAEDLSGWYLRWRSWQVVAGIPNRVFAAFSAPADSSDAGEATSWVQRSKPVYVDFESVLNLKAIDQHLRRNRGSVQLTEALPSEQELYVTSEAGHHVSEIAVELSRDALRREVVDA